MIDTQYGRPDKFNAFLKNLYNCIFAKPHTINHIVISPTKSTTYKLTYYRFYYFPGDKFSLKTFFKQLGWYHYSIDIIYPHCTITTLTHGTERARINQRKYFKSLLKSYIEYVEQSNFLEEV